MKEKIVRITWFDAKAGSSTDTPDLKVPLNEHLVKSYTYGLLAKEDEFGYLVLQEHADGMDTCDYTIIPKDWTLEVKVLK